MKIFFQTEEEIADNNYNAMIFFLFLSFKMRLVRPKILSVHLIFKSMHTLDDDVTIVKLENTYCWQYL